MDKKTKKTCDTSLEIFSYLVDRMRDNAKWTNEIMRCSEYDMDNVCAAILTIGVLLKKDMQDKGKP